MRPVFPQGVLLLAAVFVLLTSIDIGVDVDDKILGIDKNYCGFTLAHLLAIVDVDSRVKFYMTVNKKRGIIYLKEMSR